jgi:superfamily II DNA/RNA helicase
VPSTSRYSSTSGRPSSGSRTGGRPSSGRRRGGPSSTPRPAVKSDLELALDAAGEASVADDAPVPTFAELGLPEKLVSLLARRGMDAPFAIQARALPDALGGRDVLGRGQTGSGKTLAFGLPTIVRLLAGPRRTPNHPRALILVPTRELAQQVHDALAPLSQPLDLKLATVYGGSSMGRQIDQLRRGVDLVVATPGRLQDLIEQGECMLDKIEITVLDEADHMADLGFLPAVQKLLDLTPQGSQRMLFSATLDRGVDRLVREYLVNPAVHAVAPSSSPVENMDHRVWAVTHDAKPDIAAEIAARPGRTLFFVRTKHGADRLAMQLRKSGVEAGAIHGNLTQGARKHALDNFSSGHARVLVATDVAARGIHVDDVDLVVHFDPPADSKDYLHRSGRTARAGATGTVLSFVLGDQVRDHQRMRDAIGIDANAVAVTTGHPEVREIAESGEPIVLGPRRTQPAAGTSSRRPSGPGGWSRRGGPTTPRSGSPRSAAPRAPRPA